MWAQLRAAIHTGLFEATVEREFHSWYVNFTRPRVRAAIWLPLIVILATACAGGPFAELRAKWFADGYPLMIDGLRFGVILPWTVAMLVIVYTPLYQRWYSTAAQVIAPVHGVSVLLADAMMRAQGFTLSSWVVLTLLSGYFMYGLALAPAIRTVVLTLAAYVIVGYSMGLIDTQWYVDLSAMIFGGAFGGYVCYALHQSVRRNYIDWRTLKENVHRDSLTGIYNRRLFDDQIARLWQQAVRDRVQLGLLIVDIDHFKAYNDTLGHQAGDECLTKIAAILGAGARRPLDVAARYGGEEFAILLYGSDRRTMEDIAEQLRSQVLAKKIAHPASSVHPYVTVSIGGACVTPVEGRSAVGFIQLADEALYAAKERGRNRIVLMDREYDTLRTGVFRSFKPREGAAA